MAAEASLRGGGRRTRGKERREYPVTVKMSKTEKVTLSAAAQRAGMALAAYVCEAAMDAAEHRAVPVSKMHREMLAELINLAGLVRRAGTNLNQAVTRLNATGEPGPDLGASAAYCTRVLDHVDRAAELIRRRMG
ncbi:MAG: plasmid mobilization protein [Streptosporangiaceae bacterium]